MTMSAADRRSLIGIAKGRAKLAKAAVVEREKILLNEIEESLTAEFRLREEVQADVIQMAKEAVAKLNEEIRGQARLLGADPRWAPQVNLPMYGLYDGRDDKAKEPARKLAATRLAALRAVANKAIDEGALNIEESLIVGGLESDEARALVESMPTAEALMPAISLADLGVKTWQPSRDAAKELLSASTGADRRRKLVARAITQNPGASDRRIAQITGLDHKTVAKYRAEEFHAIGGEAAPDGGEVPAHHEDAS
jgi:hypothetical protein